MRNALAVLALVLTFALGAGLAWHFSRRHPPIPDGPTLILKVREVARLESLDVQLYKKVVFVTDPPRPSDSVVKDVLTFVTWRERKGRAIVFGTAHLSMDLRKLEASHLGVQGRRVEVVLPRVETRIELLPAQTEIIGSNLDSKQTADLFEAAKNAFESDVAGDKGLQERARESARQSLRSLFVGLGFQEVSFVERLAPPPGRG